jgi:hypothetical protein
MTNIDDYVLFEEYELEGECLSWDREMESWFYKGWKRLDEVVKLFNISSEDAIVLKLTYGD